jgi:preprotein translocase subunit SecY
LNAAFGGGGGASSGGDKNLNFPLVETFTRAWADPELKSRILFVLAMFAVFTLGVHIPVPVPGISGEAIFAKLNSIQAFQLMNLFGGGALRRVSIFSLGLQPYITASIIMQILQTAIPQMKKEMQEGGEYARKQQNKKTRILTIFLCLFQGWGYVQLMKAAFPPADQTLSVYALIILFWTAGAMLMLWLGEQISEKGIGNGVSLMIFAGIILSLPGQAESLSKGIHSGVVHWYSLLIVLAIFVGATWFIVFFTTAQRRIPIQHMRRQIGTRVMGGSTSYLPLSVNMAGVLPIIFAVSFIGLPSTFGTMMGGSLTPLPDTLVNHVGYDLTVLSKYLNPASTDPAFGLYWLPQGVVGAIFFTALIFVFTYFWTAIQYNVEDISNNLKRAGSFIPAVRPGKQTKDFLDGVISRITVVGATFISLVALLNYVAPVVAGLPKNTYLSVIGGTSLLIVVQVALETMRQIEANILMKQYGS